MDKNGYLGTVDYELEWETNVLEIRNEKVNEIFCELGVLPNKNDDSKSTRFKKKLCQVNSLFQCNLNIIEHL